MLHLKRKDIDTTYISYEAIFYLSLNFCRAHLDSLLEFVHKGVAEGAKLVYGGKQIDRPGELSDIRAADYIHSFLPHKVAIQGTLHVVSIECFSFITAVNKGQPVYRSPLPSVKIGRGGRGGSVHRLLRARRLGISPKCYEHNP